MNVLVFIDITVFFLSAFISIMLVRCHGQEYIGVHILHFLVIVNDVPGVYILSFQWNDMAVVHNFSTED